MTTEEQAVMLYFAIHECFKKDDDESTFPFHMDISDIGVNFFEAGVKALHLFYQKVTGDESKDLIDFTAFLTKAVFQGLMETREAHDAADT